MTIFNWIFVAVIALGVFIIAAITFGWIKPPSRSAFGLLPRWKKSVYILGFFLVVAVGLVSAFPNFFGLVTVPSDMRILQVVDAGLDKYEVSGDLSPEKLYRVECERCRKRNPASFPLGDDDHQVLPSNP
jgi:hypothetical protein